MKTKLLITTALIFIALLSKIDISAQTVVFEEDFETWQGWSQYASGSVEHSDEQSRSQGYSLKKTTNNDPNGGWKAIGTNIGREFSFEAWIYRPSDANGDTEDRISIADENYNGYGLRVTGTQINIEKRVNGAPDSNIATNTAYARPDDEWYRVVFTSNADNTFTFSVYNQGGTEQATVTSDADTDYNTFDRIVIHGGHHFYVDDITITTAKEPLPVTDGLILHLDAYDIEGLADGVNVNEWLDLSGSNNHAIQNTPAEQPTYHTDALNGLPVVRFDGNQIMEVASSPSLNFTGPGLTILTVFNPLSLQADERPMIRKDNQYQLGLFPADGTIRNLIRTDGTTGWTVDNDESFAWEAGSTKIFGFIWDGTTLNHYVDASEIGDGAEVTGDIITNTNPLLIGGENPDDNRIHADIGEVLMFDRALSSEERNELENYLYDKWMGERRTWYSLVSGLGWDDHLTWTLIAGESVNPNEEIPGPMDRVVIVDAEIEVDRNNISVGSIEVRSNGILDLGSTTGHDFRLITGQGRIKLSADNFPDGFAGDFNADNGGTVEFYGNGFVLENNHTFNNMIVNLSGNNEILTMLADYELNGNLTISRGNFRINGNNNGEHTDVLNLTIRKDLFVSTNGLISVGEANTADGFQIQGGGTLPGLGDYHSIFHQVNLYGNFTNNGTVRFTNQTAPDFQEFAGNGAAVFTFAGTRNQEVELYGTTDFYNLIVDKGNSQTHVVNVYSDNSGYFALYGPNNMGNSTGGGFTEQNPEIRKALWIRNGTLKLTGSIDIPSLTEGNERGGRGDWTVPTNGKIWIAGGDVRVYTTIRIADQRPPGTGWHKGGSGNTALTLFGSFRMDNGFFGTRHSAGFIYRSEDAATVKINGGVVDAASFRSSGAGGGGRTYYYQSGGQIRVRGNVAYGGEVGGEISAAWPLFGIIFPEGVFSMSGGEILMIGRSRANNANAYGNNAFYVASDDYSVTGGTVRLMPEGGWDYYLHSTANIWNLELERREGTGNVNVRSSNEVVISNNFSIGDNCIFHPRVADGGANHDLYVGGGFELGETNSEYNSVDGGNGNTTTFFGSENSLINILNITGPFVLEFYDLVIDKSSHDAEVNIISVGRDVVDLKDGGPFNASPVRLRNSLLVKRGILDYGDFALLITNDATIENRSSIGKIGENNGFLLVNETNQIIVPQGTSPVFGNLVIDDDVALTGNADITIGNLGMRQGIFDIGSHGITVEEDIVNIAGPYPDFDVNKFIRTGGKHSDKGVARKIPANGTYLFPLGIDTHTGEGNRYTPAEPEISGLPASDTGYVQINNVDNELPTVNPTADRALQYYWRVRHQNFDDQNLPIVKHVFTFYDVPESYEPGPNFNSCRTGKVVNLERKHSLGSLDWQNGPRILTLEFIHENTNNDPAGLSPIETGEFSTGHNQSFTGEVQVYFSRLRGTSGSQRMWGNNASWTTLTQLRVEHGDDVLNHPELWHLSDNPASNDGTPGEGQIAIIGWVPWGDTGSSDASGNPGDPHNIRQNGGTVQCAEIIFNPMLTPEGDPAPRQYWDAYFFRPTLTLTDGAVIDVPIVSGEGTIRNRQLDPDFSLVDLGDFAASDSSYVLYEVFSDVTLNNIPAVLPNLMIAPDGWGGNSRTPTIPNNIMVNQNLEIIGAARLQMNNGAEGDITVLGNLQFLIAHRDGSTHERARLLFQNNGTPRTLTVHGDIYNEGSTALYVDNPSTSEIEHTLNLYGNYIQNSSSDIGGAGNPVLRFSTAVDRDRIILNLLGEEWITFSGENTTSVIDLYSMNVNKGSSINTEANIELPLNFIGPTDGNSTDKALQLINGKLILNHAGIDINLTTGGEPFTIPSTSGLVVSQGAVSATNSNVNLSGLLRLENNGVADFEETLLYSSTGQATLQIADDATLQVEKQIRSTTANEAGVLKYNQSGGSVLIGTNAPDVDERGVFEVMNPGSEFYMTGGTLTIAGAQPDPARAAFYLRPNFYNVSDEAVIYIGHTTSTAETIEIDVSEDVSLPALYVTQGSDITAKLKDNDLTLRGNLEIGSGNAFDGSGRHLTVSGNIINDGDPALHTDSLLMAGNVQTIQGALELEHLVVNSTTSLTLEGAGTNIDVNSNLFLNSGTLHDGGNTLSVFADVHNYSTHSSTGEGKIVFSGANNQLIYGNGIFGKMEINKSADEVRLQGPMEISNDLLLTQGLLNIDRHRFTLGTNSNIVGSGGFGINQMIVSRGTFEDLGLAKRLTAGSGEFTFPIGAPGKYAPVTVDYDTDTFGASGLIAVTPINTPHMTLDINGDEEVLQFHWYVDSENLNNFVGDLIFWYDPADVEGDVEEYIAARLYEGSWFFDGFVEYENAINEDHENRIVYTHTSQNILTGDYTAGHPDDIPEQVPVYVSLSSGDWEIGENWVLLGSSPPEHASAGGPSGVIAEIEPGHTITVNNNRTIVYDLTIDGILDLKETVAHNFRTVKGSGILMLETRNLPSGRLDNFFSTPGSTIVYGGNGDYIISDRYTDFQNLVLRGSGKRELQKPTSGWNKIFGNLDIEDNVDFVVKDWLEMRGDLTKSNDATYDVSNWSYFVGGAQPQTITGNFTGTASMNRFYINKGNFYVEVNGSLDVDGLVFLRNGVVRIPEVSQLRFLRNSAFFISSDFNASWIDGKLTRRLASGSYGADSSDNLFPISKNGKKRFVKLNDISVNTQDWSVEYFDDPPPHSLDAENEEGLVQISATEHWEITGPESGQANVQLNWGAESWDQEDIDTDLIELHTVVAKWNGTEWKNKGNEGGITANGDGSGSVATNILSGFSTRIFTLATNNEDNPLPVEFLYFDAYLDGSHVILEWATATERNNSFFTVERSSDGLNFEVVAVVASKAEFGFSNNILNYSSIDTSPLEGRSYYRVKQTDFDGQYDHSNVVGVYYNRQGEIVINLYPNPNRGDEFNLNLSGLNVFESVVITIVDLYGKTVHTEFVNADDNGLLIRKVRLNKKLSAGVYVVNVSARSGRFTTRMVVN